MECSYGCLRAFGHPLPQVRSGRIKLTVPLKDILSGRSLDDQMEICFPNYEGDRVARALPGPMPAAAPQP